MYDLNELNAFSSVIAEGSLTAAARKLGLPKATLSRRIRQLEAKAGQPLLRREANGLIPTEAGTLFQAYCRRILALVDESREALNELRKDVSGELTLHVHEALARGWFSHQVEAFMARYPQVRVVLITQAVFSDAREGDQVLVWLGQVPPCGLRQEELGRLTRGLYAHPDYLETHGRPCHPRDLAAHAWVDLLGDTDAGLVLHHSREGDFEVSLPPSRMRVDQLVLQSDAIARGLGIGPLPHWIAQLRERNHPGNLEPCLPEWQAPARPVSLLYPYGHLPRRTAAFLEHIRQAVPEVWRLR